jgi:hypothetical protein
MNYKIGASFCFSLTYKNDNVSIQVDLKDFCTCGRVFSLQVSDVFPQGQASGPVHCPHACPFMY